MKKFSVSALWRSVTRASRRDRRVSGETATLVEEKTNRRVEPSRRCAASKDGADVKLSSNSLPPFTSNSPHDTCQERFATITRLLFPSHKIAAIEWLSNLRALRSLAAARFDGDTAEALRWLAPALAELTPAALLFAIRTRMPLEVTPATTYLADRITTLQAHFFPGSSEYHAYLWLNDVAKLAELARLVREGDLPATFAWISPAIDLAAELRSAAQRPWTSASESEGRVRTDTIHAWRDDFAERQHAEYLDTPPHHMMHPGLGMYSRPGVPQMPVESPELGIAYEAAVNPPPPTLGVPATIEIPQLSVMVDAIRENRLAQLASIDQQREIMRYMRALNDWLDRDVRDRQSELHGVSARVDHLRQDLAQMAMHMQAPEVPVIPQEEGRPVIPLVVPVPRYIPSPLQGYPDGFQPHHQGPVIPPCIPSIFPPIIPPIIPPVIPEHVMAEHSDYTGTPPPPPPIVYPGTGTGIYSGPGMPQPQMYPDAGIVPGPYPGTSGWGTPGPAMRYPDSDYSDGSSVVIPSPASPPSQPQYTIIPPPPRTVLSRRVNIPAGRTHTHSARSRQRATSELPLVDGGRPDIITATVKTATVKGKPARPKRARTALASLIGK